MKSPVSSEAGKGMNDVTLMFSSDCDFDSKQICCVS